MRNSRRARKLLLLLLSTKKDGVIADPTDSEVLSSYIHEPPGSKPHKKHYWMGRPLSFRSSLERLS